MQCPRCHESLARDGEDSACPTCRGRWIALWRVRALAAADPAEARARLPFIEDSRPKIPCPTCGEPMATWTVHGVPLDRCKPHGVWFDRDELSQVIDDHGKPGNGSPEDDPHAPPKPPRSTSGPDILSGVIEMLAGILELL